MITIFPAQVRFSFLLSKRFSFVQTRRNVNAFLRLMHIFTWNLILGGLSGCKEFRLYQNVSSVCWDLCHSRDLPFFLVHKWWLDSAIANDETMILSSKKGRKNRWNAAINFFPGQILNAIPKPKGCNYNDSFFAKILLFPTSSLMWKR